jgi:hypothetical protein
LSVPTRYARDATMTLTTQKYASSPLPFLTALMNSRLIDGFRKAGCQQAFDYSVWVKNLLLPLRPNVVLFATTS